MSGRSFLLMALVGFVVGWDFYSILPAIYFRAVLINQPGALNNTSINDVSVSETSGEAYGWTVASFPIMAFIFSGFFGAFTDKIGPKICLVVGLLLMVGGNIIFMIDIQKNWIAILGRAVTGLGSACRVTCLTTLSKWYAGPERGVKIGQWYAFNIVAMTVGPAVAAAISSASLWKITPEALPALINALLELAVLLLVAIYGVDKDEAPIAENILHEGCDDVDESHVSPRSPNAVFSSNAFDEHATHETFNSVASFARLFEDEESTPLQRSPRNPPSSKEELQTSLQEAPPGGSLNAPQRGPVKEGWPHGLTLLLVANFTFTLSITTFEAMLMPLLHKRFESSKLVGNLTIAGIGVVVLFSSIASGAMNKFKVPPHKVMITGAWIFFFGVVCSYGYPNVSFSGGIALETVAAILVAAGFTFAFVKTTDLFARIIVGTNNPVMLNKMGALMGILSMLASLSRAIGPLVTGYGLSASINVIVFILGAVLLLTAAMLAVGHRHLEVELLW
jgi:MFS family permease